MGKLYTREQVISTAHSKILNCRLCDISINRRNAVPGEGNIDASIMFIGEGPGAKEDRLGRPFVGTSGKLFRELLYKSGLTAEEVFITNVIKCRTPSNRAPTDIEIRNCSTYLDAQIWAIRPKIIMTLGSVAIQSYFKNPNLRITKLISTGFYHNGIIVLPNYHPSHILRHKDNYKMFEKKFKLLSAIYRNFNPAHLDKF